MTRWWRQTLAGVATGEYIFFGGKRIARRKSTGEINYYFADHLGTARVVTDASGTVLDDSDFYPFGGERPVVSTSGNTYKFSGKERDAETGNDDFGARFYSSNLGRWLSADWSAIPTPVPYANLTNPQTLNLYAFVQDNPETFADLDGHLAADGGRDDHPQTSRDTCQDDPDKCKNPPQNQPTSGEGSQANLDRRAAIAKSAEDALTRAQLTQVDPYGPNECTRLVSDSIKNAGAKAEFTPNDGPPRPPVAGEWANPNANIPGWRALGSNEKPAPGDVAAHSLPNPRPGATGDSAIVSRSGKGLTTVHAGEHGILHDPHFIRGNPSGTYRGVVYRRYIGD